MELDHAILADVVSHRPDGKLDIHGAGFDTIFASRVPAQHPRLDMAIRILFSAHELEERHKFKVVLMTPDGPELARVEADVQPMPVQQRQAIPADRRVGLGFVFNFANIVFPTYGTHHITISIDGTELRDPIKLYVAELKLPGLPGGPALAGPQG